MYKKTHSYCVLFDGFLTAAYIHVATVQNKMQDSFIIPASPFLFFLPICPVSSKPRCFLIAIRLALHVYFKLAGLCGNGVSYIFCLSSFPQPSVTEIHSCCCLCLVYLDCCVIAYCVNSHRSLLLQL